MAKGTLGQVIQRAISDAAFRNRLRTDPGGALSGFDLTPAERAALQSGDATKLASFGVDQRMSKAFAMGEAASSASRLLGTDISMGTTITDGGTPLGTNAILGDTSDAARNAVITGNTGAQNRLDDQQDGVGRSALDDQHSGVRSAVDDNATAAGRSAISDGEGPLLSGSVDANDNAFMSPDEMPSVAARLGVPEPDEASARVDDVDSGTAMANPESYDPDAPISS